MIHQPPTKDEDLLEWDEPTAPAVDARWTPPEGSSRHNGDPIPPEMTFFAPPSPEIGEVLSAESTMKASDRPKGLVSRLLLIAFAGSAAYAGLSVLEAPFEIQIIGGMIAVGLVAFLTRFRRRVSYVGTQGVAILTCKHRPDRIVWSEIFRFEDATSLIASQTRQYYNGIYSGTQYSYIWKDAAGKKRFKLSGSYHSEKKPPKPKSPFHLAEMAETAWSLRLFALAAHELEQTGRIRFKLGGSNWVAVGPGFLEFSRKDGPQRWTAEEIGDIQIGEGVVKFRHVNAKEGWFRSEGVFTFSYAQMANARLFLIALERLLVTASPT